MVKNMRKKIWNLIYPLIIVSVIGLISIFVFNLKLIYGHHDISNDDINGLVFMNEEKSLYLQFYKYYLIKNSLDDGEKYFEYRIDSKFICMTNLSSGEETNQYFIFDQNVIFDYVSKIYLYVLEGGLANE